MKFATLTITTLLPIMALSASISGDDVPTVEIRGTDDGTGTLEKRDIVGTVDADALKYRRCPRTNCDAIGQYSRGTRITMKCFTTASTTTVNGDPRWAKLPNNSWVSLYYVNWPGTLPRC